MAPNLKRTASAAGLEPSPVETKRNTRETTRVGSAKEVQTHTINGERCQITVELSCFKHPSDAACVRTVHAQFSIRRGEKATMKLGYLEGEILDKTHKTPGSDNPAWLLQVQPQKGYTGNLDTFGLANDTVTDFQKTLMAFYTRKGTLRVKYKHLEGQLSSDKFHYICHFELRPAFHGGGFAQRVMSAYLTALGNLSNGDAFKGTVLLSPAGIITATRAKEKTAKKALDWFEVVEKLITFYSKCDYEVWHRANKELKFGMNVMGQVIPRPTADLPTSTMFPPTPSTTAGPSTAATPSTATTPASSKPRVSRNELAGLTIDKPDASRTTAASEKSYYWRGRYYARTADTDPAWIAEGQKGRRRRTT